MGSVIGKGGTVIKQLRADTGANIKVIDPPGAAQSDERVVRIAAKEAGGEISPAQEALYKVYNYVATEPVDAAAAAPAAEGEREYALLLAPRPPWGSPTPRDTTPHQLMSVTDRSSPATRTSTTRRHHQTPTRRLHETPEQPREWVVDRRCHDVAGATAGGRVAGGLGDRQGRRDSEDHPRVVGCQRAHPAGGGAAAVR